MLGRQYGLASDQIVALDLVDANGDLITADASNNSDLLFASQGASELDHTSVTAVLALQYGPFMLCVREVNLAGESMSRMS